METASDESNSAVCVSHGARMDYLHQDHFDKVSLFDRYCKGIFGGQKEFAKALMQSCLPPTRFIYADVYLPSDLFLI
jgi:hypothetical protein